MPDRASVFQICQLGVEATPGTGVAANKKLQSLSIDPSIKSEVDAFRPTGTKYATVAAIGKEWTEAKLSGIATYTELIYPLSSVLATATVTTVGTSTKKWVFSPASNSADTVKTFTIEQGDATRAHKFAYGLVSELGLTFSRDGIEVDGMMLGQRLSDNITLTASPAAIALVPVLPTHVQVFLDDTQAGLTSATALTRVISAEWSIGDRFGPIWPLDSSQTSWAAHVETEPKGTVKIKMAADANGMALLSQLRSSATKFIRIKATGDITETGQNYLLQIDAAFKVMGVSEFSDEDGLFAIEWEGQIAHDATWGKATEVTIQNLIATL